MKKIIIFFVSIFLLFPELLVPQSVNCHQARFYRDDICESNNCLTECEGYIQQCLNAFMGASINVNVLVFGKECYLPFRDDNDNLIGPVATLNGTQQTSYLWGVAGTNYYAILVQPGLIGVYRSQNVSEVSLQNELDGLAFFNENYWIYPAKYFSFILPVLQKLADVHNVSLPSPPVSGNCASTDENIVQGTALYANDTYVNTLQEYSGHFKSIYCSNVVFYSPTEMAKSAGWLGYEHALSQKLGQTGKALLIYEDVYNNCDSIRLVQWLNSPKGTGDNCHPTIEYMGSEDINALEGVAWENPYFEQQASALYDGLRKILGSKVGKRPDLMPNCTGESPPGSYHPTGAIAPISSNNYKFFAKTKVVPPTGLIYANGKYVDFAGLNDPKATEIASAVEYAGSHGFDLRIVTSIQENGQPHTSFNNATTLFSNMQLAPTAGLIWLHQDSGSEQIFINTRFGTSISDTIETFKAGMNNALQMLISQKSINESKNLGGGASAAYQVANCSPFYLGVRDNAAETDWMKVMAELMAIGKDVALKAEVDQRDWNKDSLNCILDLPGLFVGIGNGLMNTVNIKKWDRTQLGYFAYELYSNKPLRDKLFGTPVTELARAIFKSKIDGLTSPDCEVVTYHASTTIIGIYNVANVVSNLGEGLDGLKKYLDEAQEPDLTPDFTKRIDDLCGDPDFHLSSTLPVQHQNFTELYKTFRVQLVADLKEIKKNYPDQYAIIKNTPEYVDAWLVMRTKPKMRKDPFVLAATVDILKDPAVMSAIGNQESLGKIISGYKRGKCCANDLYDPPNLEPITNKIDDADPLDLIEPSDITNLNGVLKMVTVLQSLKTLAGNPQIATAPGFQSLLSDLKSNNLNAAEGAAFQLAAMAIHKNTEPVITGLLESQIIKIDQTFLPSNTGKMYDLHIETQTGAKNFFEFKSYKNVGNLFYISAANQANKNLEQMSAYFDNAETIDNVKYYIQQKGDVNLLSVQNKFRQTNPDMLNYLVANVPEEKRLEFFKLINTPGGIQADEIDKIVDAIRQDSNHSFWNCFKVVTIE